MIEMLFVVVCAFEMRHEPRYQPLTGTTTQIVTGIDHSCNMKRLESLEEFCRKYDAPNHPRVYLLRAEEAELVLHPLDPVCISRWGQKVVK